MEEIKDLGGLVNKDVAFNKLPPNILYDSQNFRVLTTDGATTGARENLKGTVEANAAISGTTCVSYIEFDITALNLYLVPGVEYTIGITLQVQGIPGISTIFPDPSNGYTYSNPTNLIQDVFNFLNNNPNYPDYSFSLLGNRIVVSHSSGNCIFKTGFNVCEYIPGGGPPPTNPYTGDALFTVHDKDFNGKESIPAGVPPNSISPWTTALQTNVLTPVYINPLIPIGSIQFADNSSSQTAPSGIGLFHDAAVEYFPPANPVTIPTNPSTVRTALYTSITAKALPVSTYASYVIQGKTVQSVIPLPNGSFSTAPIGFNDSSHPFNVIGPVPLKARMNFFLEVGSYSVVRIRVYADFGYTPYPAAQGYFERIYPLGGLPHILWNGSNAKDDKFLKIGEVTFANTNNASPITVDRLVVDEEFDCLTLYNNGLNLAQILDPTTASQGLWDYHIVVDLEVDNALHTGTNYQKSYQLFVTRFSCEGDTSIIGGPPPPPNPTCFPGPFVKDVVLNPGGLAGSIIGWTTLRDNIYLITTDSSYDPDNPSGVHQSTGQIWELSYDKTADYSDPNIYNLRLVHSSQLNLTTYRPIANPGMIESRYESPDVQKIYWTDNYNPPRQINVAPTFNAGILLPEDLNLQPALSMDLPMITEVLDGGSLLVGVYQVAYRLKNANGAESRFSRTSNSIPIIDAPEAGATVQTYFPSVDIQEVAGKSIRVKVDNIDQNYNTIEFVTLYYTDDISTPEIYIVKEAPISSISIEVIISGDETQIPISLEEFTAFNTIIKRCKTLAATKQTLFLGNITISGADINFDARAYRFPHPTSPGSNGGTITYVEDTPGTYIPIDYNGGSFTYNNTVDPVPEDANCAQSYYNQSPFYLNANKPNYLYQPGTNILGGAGPNVKYEFVTSTIELDVNTPAPDGPVGGSFYNKGGQSSGPHYVTSTNPSVTFNNFKAKKPSRSDYGSPYNYDVYKGYRRDEMYRFGIVFFDELDNPTYVKWIADIRMPHIYMPDDAATNSSVPYISNLGKRSRQVSGSPQTNPNGFSSDPIYYQKGQVINNLFYPPKLYAKPLGIKFTIDFSTVPDRFKKASIVRVPLDDNNRHIYGQGLFLPTFNTQGVPTTGAGSGSYNDTNAVFLSYPSNAGNTWYDTVWSGGATLFNKQVYDCWTLRCPEQLYKKNYSFQSGDAIDVINVLYPNTSDVVVGGGFAVGGINTEANNIASDRTYLQILDASGTLKAGRTNPLADRVDFSGDKKYLVAWKTKYYYSVEVEQTLQSTWFPSLDIIPGFGAGGVQGSVPMTMKRAIGNGQYDSKNPYPVIKALEITAGSGSRDYTQGNIGGNFTSATRRTVHACTPRNLNVFPQSLNLGLSLPVNIVPTNGAIPGADYGNISQEGKYIHSYTNNCLFVQLLDANARNFASETVSNGGRFTKFDRVETMTANNYHTFKNGTPDPGNIVLYPSYSQYLANYKRSIVNPFGGQDYFSRSSSQYISCNNLIDISTKSNPITTTVYGGDTAISVMDYVIQFPDRIEAQNTPPAGATALASECFLGYHVAYVPVETSVALEYRRSFENTKNLDSTAGVPNRTVKLVYDLATSDPTWDDPALARIEAYEYFKVDRVFNHDSKSVYRFFPKPITTNFIDTFDCRVIKSAVKIDGESTESWSVFRPDAKLDVESAYGPINNLVVFQGKLYYFQDRAFGLLQVNEQKLISDSTSGADLVLGSSGILERYDYISTKTGTKHQFSMHVSDYTMVWFDVLARKMYRFKGDGLQALSDIKGYNALLYNKTGKNLQIKDNPYRNSGIHSTYDYRYNEFYMTFLNGDSVATPEFVDTIVYNELLDGFVGSYTHYPKVYINDKINIFSVLYSYAGRRPDRLHIHNQGPYGSFYNQASIESKLTFVVNGEPTLEKVFTNFELIAEAYKPNSFVNLEIPDVFEYNKAAYQYAPLVELDYNRVLANTAIRVYDTYQNTGWRRLFQSGTRPIARKHKTIWNIKVPTDRVPYSAITNLPNIFERFEPIIRTVPGAYVTGTTKRFKDKWFAVDLAYDNSSNTKLVAYSAKAIYSLNSR